MDLDPTPQDGAPSDPRDGMDFLLNAVVPYALERLKEDGAFYPFAGKLSESGEEVTLLGVRAGEEPTDPAAVLETSFEALAELAAAGEIRGGAVCADVRVSIPDSDEESDAIRVSIEHVGERAIDVYLPYTVDEAGELRFGELFASVGEPKIFTGA
jgi:hypothetical protein